MKHKIRSIVLIILVICLGLIAACSKEDPEIEDNSTEDLNLNVGFLTSKYQEGDNSFVDILVEGDGLKLEVKDQGVFDSLMDDEFYIFAYNDDMVLREIDTDLYLKTLVLASMDQKINDDEVVMDEDSNEDDDIKDVEPDEDKDDRYVEEIKPSTSISFDGLTLLDEYIYDFNKDGQEESISMYVAAERDSNGQIMWDDGQRWVLVVHGDNKDYVLLDDYVQLGSIDFKVFTKENNFYITTIDSRTAEFKVSQYRYDSNKDIFLKTLPIEVMGNVNMLYNSSGF